MTLKQRIQAFAAVGSFIDRHFSQQGLDSETRLHQGLDKLVETAGIYNNWFIPTYVNEAIASIGLFLSEKELTAFTANLREVQPKTIAIICAGNIPLVSEIAPLLIVTKLEQFDYAGAAAIGAVMLAASFIMLLALNGLQAWSASRR